ncbi:DNA repair protein complementing XP-A cells [Schistocerca americana]|uniref:DNA repair protein complementing XP-A cells n=1 Tax=Schistocerca americana TaxID=7009 RepID=UPI001F4FF91B|nr:DNA repair protein complementing XP-A cells [Schistocerca americana]XP_047118198.1 DNA repair protein complementing XP-A cells [Schistocerca piceifrons]
MQAGSELSVDEALDLEAEIAAESNSEQYEQIELTDAQKSTIERNRQKALLLKKARASAHPYSKNEKGSPEKNTIKVQGTRYIDTGGGFLLEEKAAEENAKPVELKENVGPVQIPYRPTCEECSNIFDDSFLYQSFEYPVCDGCRDRDDKHSLITRTDAKNEYLLKDCDLDMREPPLKFIMRKNPHNMRWGTMKLYLRLQIEKRALEVWGSEEKLEEELEKRDEKRSKAKIKKYNKQVKALRMAVRSSLYDRTKSATHTHEFGPEKPLPDQGEDTYTRKCTTCGYEEIFEKM